MNKIKLSLVAALLAGTTTLSADFASDVEVSANVAMTSNYIWRGMTQSSNSPAIQGGVDLGYKGAYLGVWGSNVDFGSSAGGYNPVSAEFDIYLGYANSIADFSYDAGLIQYMYPSATDESNFAEAYVTLGYDFGVASVSAMYALGIDTNSVTNEAANGWEPGDTIEFGVSVPLPAEITLDATYGMMDDSGTLNQPTNSLGDYYLVSASKSFGKFDFTLAYTGMDYDAAASKDQDNVVLTVGTSF
ncbi:MAG: TorF family putative porin [Sulfurimonas sp.]|nr:TorF family putative porin [Sulfurimonas sp.]MDQ7059743.1 TorF family putative porin [Sulfurimonas sp.]